MILDVIVGGVTDAMVRVFSRPDWREAEARAKHGAVNTADARVKAILGMVMTAQATAKGANGQTVERTMKNKEFRFSTREEAEIYLDDMMREQDELCAFTDMRLQYFDGADPEYRPSLDRIDSNGHYEPGNLKIVCRFANRWKGAGDDALFRRLIGDLRAAEMIS